MVKTILGKEIEVPNELLHELDRCGHPFSESYYERLLKDSSDVHNELISLVKDDIEAGKMLLSLEKKGKL